MPTEPVYMVIYNDIRNDIFAGKLKNGDMIDSEMEIAKRYNVSRITAKAAIDKLKSDGLIIRIKGKGSFVNYNGKNASNRNNNDIALIIPCADSDPSIFKILEGINSVVEERGYRLVIYNTGRDSETECAALVRARFDSCTGIIYYPGPVEVGVDILMKMSLDKYPFVVLDKKIEYLEAAYSVSDNITGSKEAMQHLIEKGHKKFAFLDIYTGLENTARERFLGCTKAITENNMDLSNISIYTVFKDEGDFKRFIDNDFAKEVENRSLDLFEKMKNNGITAVCTLNDHLALIFCRALVNAGVKIPQEIAVVGFDDLEISRYNDPPLTSVRQDLFALGRNAALELDEIIRNPDHNRRTIVTPTKLVVREST